MLIGRRRRAMCSAGRSRLAARIPPPASSATATAIPARRMSASHTICASVTAEFLEFSREHGNDLGTPRPEFMFPGLVSGDRWCLCAARWLEAAEAGAAPPVVLIATHEHGAARRATRIADAARARPQMSATFGHAVVDTNVLLDFWVFADPGAAPLWTAFEAGSGRCMAQRTP